MRDNGEIRWDPWMYLKREIERKKIILDSLVFLVNVYIGTPPLLIR